MHSLFAFAMVVKAGRRALINLHLHSFDETCTVQKTCLPFKMRLCFLGAFLKAASFSSSAHTKLSKVILESQPTLRTAAYEKKCKSLWRLSQVVCPGKRSGTNAATYAFIHWTNHNFLLWYVVVPNIHGRESQCHVFRRRLKLFYLHICWSIGYNAR